MAAADRPGAAPDELARAARSLGLMLPPECVAGVAANLAALADHGAIVRAALAAVASEPGG